MTPDIPALVAALPERYQPIYGEGEDAAPAARRCDDRLAVIAGVVAALRAQLDRPVRVLDLGCAQGYFSLSLAALGAEVIGVDRGAANVALCKALASRHPDLRVAFVEADIVEHAAALAPGEADVVLGLSVVHHVAHEQSPAKVRLMLSALAGRCELLLVETALRTEPVYWAASLPDDAREHFADVPFVHALARFPTHLSGVARPLFFASARWWRLGPSLERFDRWTAQPHEFGANVHGGTRRYYFGRHFAKQYLLTGEAGERNRAELAGESAFLRDPAAGIAGLPRVIASGTELDQGYLVREMIAGTRLSGMLLAGAPVDAMRVVGDVLNELCALEEAHLYHGDVRPWNVIVKNDGCATLIDYGDIVADAVDCAWPADPFTAFLVFASEVQSGAVHPPSDLRSLRFAPHEFEGPLHAWATHLWGGDGPWTFTSMREGLRGALGGGTAPSADAVTLAERHAGNRVRSLLATRYADIDALHREKLAVQAQLAGEHRAYVDTQQALAESLEANARDGQAAGVREEAGAQRLAEIAGRLEASERARQDALESIQQHVADVDALRAREAQVAHARDALAASNAELDTANRNLLAANVDLDTANKRLQAVNAGLDATNKRLLAANDDLDSVNRTLLATSADLASSRAQIEATLAQVAAAHAKLGEEHEALCRQCESLEVQRVAAHAEAHRWWQQSTEWHREWQAIQQTRSWRLTAPLRWAKRSAAGAIEAARGGPSTWMRPAVNALAAPLMRRPVLRYRVASLTRRIPSLHERLRDYVKPAAIEPGDAAEDAGAAAYLTPRARQVLRDMDRARERAPES